MTTREEVHGALIVLFGPELAEVWWSTKLPVFGGLTAEQLWAQGDRHVVVDRVALYLV